MSDIVDLNEYERVSLSVEFHTYSLISLAMSFVAMMPC